jgi:DsbC/DsbD-like thiol-disulfide interchange protein
MMKHLIVILMLVLGAFSGFSQSNHPVTWTFETQALDSNFFNLIIKAEIKEPWHIYPQKTSGGALGMPTQITFEENDNIELVGKTEGKAADQSTKPNAPYFSKGAVFIQKLKLKSKTASNLNFKIRYMACTNAMCLPPTSKQFTVEFTEKDFKKDN